jgi:hypothetical protein
MKKLSLLLAFVLLFGFFTPVHADAPPPLPSSFWGYVTGYPAGTIIRAYVPGQTASIAYASVFLWEGIAVWTINVPGDLEETPAKDGGVEGDVITFRAGGRIVATAVWHSGTVEQLDIVKPPAKKR